jgi:hypothetical protein
MILNSYLCRWVKFEEDVEEGGNRWSKPHVATLSLHSLFELRSLLTSGSGQSSWPNQTLIDMTTWSHSPFTRSLICALFSPVVQVSPAIQTKP